MASFIVYSNSDHILRTVNDLIDRTPKSLIDEIIICNDIDNIEIPGAECIQSNKIGRPRAWNIAAERAKGKELVFLGGPTKFSQDWFEILLEEIGDDCIVSPIIHTLDTNLWSMEDNRWERFGWRWDLELYNRIATRSKNTPAVSSYCMAITKERFLELGGFDHGMNDGYGEDIELSLRNWLFGGKCLIADESRIASVLRPDVGLKTNRNLMRIVEAWMPEYATRFYQARNINHDQINCGRIDNLIALRERQKISVDSFLSSLQPELFDIYKLKGTGFGKSIAVIGPSASIDLLNSAWVNRHDIVIGVDYVGMNYDCDYVITDTAHIITELRKSYQDNKMVLPTVLANRAAGRIDSTSLIIPDAIQFELGRRDSVNIDSVDPPFCNFDNLALTAVHFALYLNPKYITLFGCDNKIINGKSHSAKIQYYDGGDIWTDSDAVRKKFAFFEYGLDRLGNLAQKLNIPLFRMNHV